MLNDRIGGKRQGGRLDRLHELVVVAACAALVGCASYAPPTLDKKSGSYSTIVEVDKGGVLAFETDTDPRRFGTVLLIAESNVYPERFEFFNRQALADLGMLRVQNPGEMAALLDDHGLGRKVDADAVAAFSSKVQPVLVIEVKSQWDGDVRRYVKLRVIDSRDGRVLLEVDHPRLIWMDVDSEAHYPVFNELRRWYSASTAKQG